MINSFLLSFDIKNTYRTNGIIYYLKNFPIIRNILPGDLYKHRVLKIIANVISGIVEFTSIFLWKFLYLYLMIFIMSSLYQNPSISFINIFVFLTLIGGILNTSLFDPSRDKYYAIVLMRFDAKRYVLCNYLYFILKNLVGLMPIVLILGYFCGINLLLLILFPIFVIMVKMIANFIFLYLYKHKNYLNNENKFNKVSTILVIILLLLAYGLPYLNIGITPLIFIILTALLLPLSIISYKYILRYNLYTNIYRKILKRDDVVIDKSSPETELYSKMITVSDSDTSDSEGFEFFNDLFVKRHKKVLTKSTKKFSLGAIIIIVLLVAICVIFKQAGVELNAFLKISLPYFLFIMYFMNRGKDITMCMFMNCDHAMLTYRFYREPSTILKLFKEKLKTIFKLNVIPGFIIALGTLLLLYVTGGATMLQYVVTFVTIISMSIFFSVHYLVLYYLLQPYNIDLEIKNPTFTFITSLTYIVCYLCINVELPTLVFGTIFILFTVIYSLISLFIAYKYSYKTFMLK